VCDYGDQKIRVIAPDETPPSTIVFDGVTYGLIKTELMSAKKAPVAVFDRKLNSYLDVKGRLEWTEKARRIFSMAPPNGWAESPNFQQNQIPAPSAEDSQPKKQ
jgi:hypothetical protein